MACVGLAISLGGLCWFWILDFAVLVIICAVATPTYVSFVYSTLTDDGRMDGHEGREVAALLI